MTTTINNNEKEKHRHVFIIIIIYTFIRKAIDISIRSIRNLKILKKIEFTNIANHIDLPDILG